MKRLIALALLLAALPVHAIIKSQPSSGAGGSGTVTSVSVATANGFAGTVANPTTTPAITLTTTVSGLLTGNTGAITAAVYTDVSALWTGTCNSTTILFGGGACASLTSANIPATLNGVSVTVVGTANLTLSGAQTIDGFLTTAATSIVLATAQSTPSQNGPWIVQSGAWTRPAWYPSGGTTQVTGYSSVQARQGTLYIGTTWKQTAAAPITIDTTSTVWAQVVGVGNFTSLKTSLTGQTANVNPATPDFENATPATSGNQQPLCVTIGGQGYATTPATSQSIQLQICATPTQGATNPSLSWGVYAVINGGTPVELFQGSYLSAVSYGVNFNGTGNLFNNGNMFANGFRVNGTTSTVVVGTESYACASGTAPTCYGVGVAGTSVQTWTTTISDIFTNFAVDTLGSGLQVKEGSNGKQGVCTLAAGTCTVTTTSITANSRVFITGQSLGTVAVPSAYGVSARTPGTSFVITASAPTDTSIVAYEIFEPAP